MSEVAELKAWIRANRPSHNGPQCAVSRLGKRTTIESLADDNVAASNIAAALNSVGVAIKAPAIRRHLRNDCLCNK